MWMSKRQLSPDFFAISVSRRSAGTSASIGSARVSAVTLEINPREQMRQQPAHEDNNRDVRRLHFPAGPGHLPRLDRVEEKLAVLVGRAAAEAFERRIRHARITRMGVAPLRIGLPDFDHRVVHGLAVAVIDDAFDVNAIADSIGRDEIFDDRLRPVVIVPAALRRQAIRIVGTDGLRRRQPKISLVIIFIQRCLLAPAQHDIEFIRQRPFRHGRIEIERRDHPRPRLLVRVRN